MTRGYLIGEGFRDRIERTIERVAGAPYGGGVTNVTKPRLEMIGGGGGKAFRICTYTGSWSIGDTKTVTFKYQTATPNTATVVNLFFPVTSTAAGSRDCAIAKDGTAWFLVDVRFATASAVFATGTQAGIMASSTASQSVLTDVTLSASLNTSACTISIGKTLVTASRIFVTGTATAVFVTGTSTATYLRLE